MQSTLPEISEYSVVQGEIVNDGHQKLEAKLLVHDDASVQAQMAQDSIWSPHLKVEDSTSRI